MIPSPTCPSCGTALARGRSGDICPACLLRAAMRDGSIRPFIDHPLPDLAEIRALFPDLEIIGLIGRGGMGAVYQVRQPTLDRFAALKILPRDLAAEPGFRERFHREARTMAALNHPNIVTIHESGERDGLFFLLMEFVDGGDLGRAIRSGNLKPRETLAIIPQICEALQYAHDAGVVHRDIKPGNILLDARGRVKVADFGIARMVGETHDSSFPRSYLLGTPEYMAPEQRDGAGSVDHRADIYSLGAVFYELLTGRPPPEGSRESPSKQVTVDARIDDVVQRAMAADPALRYQNANEMRQVLERISRPRSRSAGFVAAGLVAGAIITAIALLPRDRKPAAADPFPPVWENSLGMRFRPVPGTGVRMSIWETRIGDWKAFEKAGGATVEIKHADVDPQAPVALRDASLPREFCAWLTRTEQAAGRITKHDIYRLPTDREWSLAAGLIEPADGTPDSLHLKNRRQYPWGTLAPAPAGSGNYPDSALLERMPHAVVIPNYYDGHAFIAPAGSFPANAAGFHDLGGNLWEAVTTGNDDGHSLVFRGGSWFSGAKGGGWDCLLSSFRAKSGDLSHLEVGFRVVLAKADAKAEPDLLAAARDGNAALIAMRLAAGDSLEQRDSAGRSALHLAASAGNIEALTALIKAGAGIDARNQNGETALHAATSAGHLPAVEALVKAGAKTTARTQPTGTQPIHSAAARNQPAILSFLTDHGADLQAQDHMAGTPLHYAASSGARDAIQWLVGHKVQIDQAGSSNASALGLAVLANDIETCALLLQLGASANPLPDSLQRPLALAAMNANADLVQLLLDHGADPKRFEIGMAAGMDLSFAQLGKSGGKPEKAASLPLLTRPTKPGDRDKTIRLLAKHGMPLEQRNPKGFTPLLNAAYMGNTEAVQTLLDLGATPDAADNEGFNALHSAAEQGYVKVVELLLAKGAKPDVPNGTGRTAMDCAAIGGHHEIVTRLLDAGAVVEGLPEAVTTPVSTAARQGHPKTLAILLERGGKAGSSSKTDGATPLIRAAAGPEFSNSALKAPGSQASPTGTAGDYTQCVRLLLDHGANTKAAMHDGTTALHAAANFNATESLKLLISAGIPVDILDHKAFTPLHRAAQRDSAEAARELLDRGAKPAHPLNPTSPLHTAAAAGSDKVAELLLERGADPNLRDGRSITPLHWAVSMGHPAMVALLAKHKADLAARDFAYNTPLHCAVISGKPEIVRALLNAGADPALRNVEGATALDYAIARQLDSIIAILSSPDKP